MNYALCENESVSSSLEQIAFWMVEEDKNIPPEIRKRLVKVSDDLLKCSHEFNQIVEDYYKEN